MTSTFLLPLLILIPLLAGALCALLPSARQAKILALLASLATTAVAGALAWQFNWHGIGDDARVMFGGSGLDSPFYLDYLGFGFRLSADSVSLWLVLLTVVLMPLSIAASFQSIRDRAKEYYAWMLVLLAAMNGVFISQDLLLFYIFFELTLIPMFFIIGIWGGPERRFAAGKFFLFTFSGSVLMLAAIIYIGIMTPSSTVGGISFDIDDIRNNAQRLFEFHPNARIWLALGLLAGFAVKIPLFPVHTWLPLAHTEAPTAGSVILAGVLLKLGTYGLYKIAIPIGLIDATGAVATPTLLRFLGVLCVIGILYGALVAWVQQDIKKLVAYSSVSHLGFCVLGLIALNDIGVGGSVLYMLNPGLSTGAMFLVIGMIYDRFHTRDMNELSGLARRMPIMSFFFVFFTLSSIGLPGLNGFVSEFLTVLGAFTSSHLGIAFGSFAALGIILGALYMLHMVARIIFGPLKFPGSEGHDAHGHEPHGHDRPHGHGASRLKVDLGGREIAVLLPLALVVVLLGVQPNLVLKTIAGPIKSITAPSASVSEVRPIAGDRPAVVMARP
jgi:NADH-quinone oxidoreductase subunit M